MAKVNEIERIVNPKGGMPDDYPKWLRRRLRALVRKAHAHGELYKETPKEERDMWFQKDFGFRMKP
jgi:hypothetical protein